MVFALYTFQLQNNAIVDCEGGLIDILYKKRSIHIFILLISPLIYLWYNST